VQEQITTYGSNSIKSYRPFTIYRVTTYTRFI